MLLAGLGSTERLLIPVEIGMQIGQRKRVEKPRQAALNWTLSSPTTLAWQRFFVAWSDVKGHPRNSTTSTLHVITKKHTTWTRTSCAAGLKLLAS